MFLDAFEFPDNDQEFDFMITIQRQCYSNFYPFGVLSKIGLKTLSFEPVTILYGGNGSGKSTALNVMAEALMAERDAAYNRSSFFEAYLERCDHQVGYDQPRDIRIVTSDDVFNFMLDMRALNQGIDLKRTLMFEDYLDHKYATYRFKSLDDYDNLKKINQAKSNTQSMYVKKNLMANTPGKSNGENGFMYFTNKIKEEGLYFLDEPENSLSPERQLELLKFLEDSARFFSCQFIIATHSPFLLSFQGAKVYNLDQNPARSVAWTDLVNVRVYWDFFRRHKDLFEG